jgi:hypothetical protein
MAEGLQGW